MHVQWEQRPRVNWLGAATGDKPKAKLLLASWSKFRAGESPVPGYGTNEDLIGPWSDRDQKMMKGFVDWWEYIGGQPRAYNLAKEDTPSKVQNEALESWAKQYAEMQQNAQEAGSSSSSNVGVLVGIAAALAIGYALL